MDSVSPNAFARSPLFSSPDSELRRYDMIFTRAGSAMAFKRSATCSASSSLIGPAATGAQHTGVEMSIVGNALGMNSMMPGS